MVIFDLEHLEDVNEGDLVVGGDGVKLVIVTTGAVTGATVGGGSIRNFTNSSFNIDGALDGSFPKFSTNSTAISGTSRF